MSLPEAWVDRIFERLLMVYGNDFMRRWDGQEIGDVKAHWGKELAGYAQSPNVLSYALDNLPADKPPNVLQFRAICMRAPQTSAVPLLSTNSTPASASVAREALAAIDKERRGGDPKAWAWRLKARHDAGEKLNANQIRCYKNALFLHPNGVQL